MAEEKKGPRTIHPMEPVIVGLIFALILGEIVRRLVIYISAREGLSGFFHNLLLFLHGEISFSELIGATHNPFLAATIFVIRILLFVLSGVFLWLIFSTNKKFKDVQHQMMAPLHGHDHGHGHGHDHARGHDAHAPEKPVNPRWQKVLDHINSPNPSDWKLAILESDIILNDMLEKMGYHGETISDKLKSIEPSDFDHLEEAWEAHKIRNAIAHEGMSYEMNKPEAERVIKLFKKVFEEFKYI